MDLDLYSAFIVVPHTQGAQVRITQCYLQITPYLPLPCKRSGECLQGRGRWCLHRLRWQTSNCSQLLIYLPGKDERLSWPGWLTCSRQFTDIGGHSSAAGRAQDRKSSLVKDQRSTTVPCSQP